MNFIKSILGSLYSVDFYKRVIREPLSFGLLYLTSWAFFTVFIVVLFLGLRVYPEVNGFLNWVEETLPPIQWTPEGARMSQKSPFEMTHPKYGHVATINLDKKAISDAEMGDVTVYITSEKLYLKESTRGSMRIYDLVPPADPKTKRGNIIIDGALIRGLEKTIKPVAFGVIVFLVFIGFFVWKLLAALFYTLPGLLINTLRREKLSYEAVLNVSFFAMTAAICIQFLLLALSAFSVRLPFGFLGSFVFTGTYLYLGIKFTEDPLETETPLEEIPES